MLVSWPRAICACVVRVRAFCIMLVVFVLAPLPAVAIPPAIQTHYDLVPRRSVLLQTGGFAGVQQRYHLEGDYDFVEDWDYPTDPPALVPYAYFTEADIRAPLGPMLPAFIDVDYLLNLEGLRGELLPLGAPFDVWRFRGRINDSDAASPLEQSTIDLFAAQIGPWMYLYGQTTAPTHTADYFEYTIKALARRGRWADMNDDGVVDSADYTMVRDRDAAAGSASFDPDAVTVGDWQSQYGETLPDESTLDWLEGMALSYSTSTAAAVPEPGALAIVLVAVACWRRRG